jgi:hypothetical protein
MARIIHRAASRIARYRPSRRILTAQHHYRAVFFIARHRHRAALFIARYHHLAVSSIARQYPLNGIIIVILPVTVVTIVIQDGPAAPYKSVTADVKGQPISANNVCN